MTQLPSSTHNPVNPSEIEDYFDYFYDLPGSEPGTLSIDEDAIPSQLILIDYSPETATRKVQVNPLDCIPYLTKDSVSWLDIQGLGSEDILKQLGDVFSLHPLLLEDVVNVPQRPKVQEYEQQLVIIVQMVLPKQNQPGFHIEQIGFVMGKNYLLSFQEKPLDCFDPVRRRIRSNKGKVRITGVDYLAYLLLDSLIDSFFPILEDYGERIEILEDEVVLKPTRHTLEKIYELRRELLALRRAIWPQRNLINTILRDGNDFINPDVQVYFRDCYDHVIQLLDIVETYRELASSLMDVYMSSINNKMNEVVNLLTIISTIFIPLSFLAGVYGMNFEVMPELKWEQGYLVFWLICLTIALGLLYLFWRRGWLNYFSSFKND